MRLLYLLATEFEVSADEIGIPNIQANGGTLNGILAQVFALVGALAFLFLVIGALRYVTSGGDSSQVKQAKDTMLYSVIGLVIAVSAYGIIQFVSTEVTK